MLKYTLSIALLIIILTDAPKEPTTAGGTDQLTIKLPDGIKCVGGSDKNRCLASLVTTAGYGNCVVVTQTGTNGKRDVPGDKKNPEPVPPKVSPTPPPPPPKEDKKVNGKRAAPVDKKNPEPVPPKVSPTPPSPPPKEDKKVDRKSVV